MCIVLKIQFRLFVFQKKKFNFAEKKSNSLTLLFEKRIQLNHELVFSLLCIKTPFAISMEHEKRAQYATIDLHRAHNLQRVTVLTRKIETKSAENEKESKLCAVMLLT